jgi:hypothetical protein
LSEVEKGVLKFACAILTGERQRHQDARLVRNLIVRYQPVVAVITLDGRTWIGEIHMCLGRGQAERIAARQWLGAIIKSF